MSTEQIKTENFSGLRVMMDVGVAKQQEFVYRFPICFFPH